MKKRMMGILFVLAALVALCTLSVSAADLEFPTDGSVLKDGWCEHCQDEADWLPLTQAVMDGWGKDYDPTNPCALPVFSAVPGCGRRGSGSVPISPPLQDCRTPPLMGRHWTKKPCSAPAASLSRF